MVGSSAPRAAAVCPHPFPLCAGQWWRCTNGGGKQMRGFLSWGGARFVWSSWVATIGVMIATGDTVAAPGDAFQQASDGIVSIEAEHPDANVANGGQSFVASSEAGASGSAALAASPNSDVARDTG